MKLGYLSDLFLGVGWKRLSAVEVDAETSNQHEFNGSKTFEGVLGRKNERRIKQGTGIPAEMFYFGDSTEDEGLQITSTLSWYDTRKNQKHRCPEWRLYYQENPIIGGDGCAAEGDLLIIAFAEEIKSASVIVAKRGSTYERQLMWLFGIPHDIEFKFEVKRFEKERELDLTTTQILERLNIVVPVEDDRLLEKILHKFGDRFPSGLEFSTFARGLVPEVRAIDDADAAIIKWMEQEEVAFRVLEKHIVEKKLIDKFRDVDDFVSYSLSVQNRRKARAGFAFEYQLCEVFREHGLAFSLKGIVEDNVEPDFIFPSVAMYATPTFPSNLLTILGAKTSCKDRWRQVLAEGKRVTTKHLVTLEPAISSTQIAEMKTNFLQLVVPNEIHKTYSNEERKWLWDLRSFVKAVEERQSCAQIPKSYEEPIRSKKKKKSRQP